jgi:hypothetical protein
MNATLHVVVVYGKGITHRTSCFGAGANDFFVRWRRGHIFWLVFWRNRIFQTPVMCRRRMVSV